MSEEQTSTINQLEAGTYEIIQGRLQKQKSELLNRLTQLNDERKSIFGAVDLKLKGNKRINTDNNCIARDVISFGDICLLGYNVHIGLRSKIKLSDVFSAFHFVDGDFKATELTLINDETFINDFENLYKYYRDTIFARFSLQGNYLHMVFQISEKITDVKTFKWLMSEQSLTYIDNRSDHEYRFPAQHEFEWVKPDREMHRHGLHAHVSILDRVFVETIGGDLTIKIEDNTEDGQGIYSEPVEFADQTLDDAEFYYANLGNLIILKIRPYQEDYRYFVYNHKVQEVYKIDSIKDSTLLLPEGQGILFPNGYYLQTGTYKLFDKSIEKVKFLKRLAAPNGEDFIFVFYEEEKGDFVLIFYNIIDQEIKTPIICNGYTLFPTGDLCYFKSEADATKHHVIQIWQTPFTKEIQTQTEHVDSLIYKIGNKDIVRAMAESRALIGLLNKEDSYDGLYDDIAKLSNDIVDSYYWIREEETYNIAEPVAQIESAANTAIDEFEKVVQLKLQAKEETQNVRNQAEELFDTIKHSRFTNIQEFVEVLANLRQLRGVTIGLKDIRYTQPEFIEGLEADIVEKTGHISNRCVDFLLDENALKPYSVAVSEKEASIDSISKVIEGKNLEKEVNQISTDLELLIDIVNNLEIEDTSHSTKIIDGISAIFSELNKVKSALKRKMSNLGSAEAQADFAAQIKLFDQSVVNALDLALTPDKCDEYLTKLSVQLEEVEGKFAEYDEFVTHIIEKREEVYSAFDGRKNTLIEKRNKRALTLLTSAERILKGVEKKSESFSKAEDIHAYFASDLMISKIRDIVEQLQSLNDSGKAEQISAKLKITKEESLRKLKDKLELYEDGENIIKLGKQKFGVNHQPLDLNIVEKENQLYFHLSGSDFYELIEDESITNFNSIWNQEYISENAKVYRGEYLAYQVYTRLEHKARLDDSKLTEAVKAYTSKYYTEGYTKGVHDADALEIIKRILRIEQDMNLLSFSSEVRGRALLFWNQLEEEAKQIWLTKFKSASGVLNLFPNTDSFEYLLKELEEDIRECYSDWKVEIPDLVYLDASVYLFKELTESPIFTISGKADNIYKGFTQFLEDKQVLVEFRNTLASLNTEDKLAFANHWLKAYLQDQNLEKDTVYNTEVGNLLIYGLPVEHSVNVTETEFELKLHGNHIILNDGNYAFNYHNFFAKLKAFKTIEVVNFENFKIQKQTLLNTKRKKLKLEEFQPKVLSSFVRNKLIDKVYLPLFGDNLAKQIGTVGDNKRVDRMGMLLLISPPGYGKTTLMEYIANRLGLTFMKINGPAIGHEVTSVDPMSANNSAAREELKKLNLAFEMGNNVMLYLDDIQHCNPEFLQKFISLADGQRKIEGVYNGEPKTYDFRDKKFCVIMAGNPYTESGDKFQIPDMLTNRADIYNLGDIIGETASLFNLSLIENSLSSNPTLRALSAKGIDDVYELIRFIESGKEGTLDLKGNHTKQDVETYVSVLEKLLSLRNVVLKVNETYIHSASMEDEYREEPSFKLQGSYRDMNKLSEKVVPIMNEEELQVLINSHYENEAQTLTSSAEANLLKFKELIGELTEEGNQRWEDIKTTFIKNKSGSQNDMNQLLAQLMKLSEGLEGIKSVLGK